MVLKWFRSTVARCMVLQSIAVNATVYSGLGFLSSTMLTLVLGLGCPLVGLGGPVIGISLPEDLVVLKAGTDGPVSTGEWSWNDLIPMGILLCLCEGIFLMGVGILWTWRVGLGTACSVSMSMPVLSVSDSLCRHDESAAISAGEPSVSLVSPDEVLLLVLSVLHSLSLGRVWTGCCRW